MEFLPGIHMVPGVPWSRIYLIEDASMALVDTGPPWQARKVLSYIRSIGRNPDDLGLILVTHNHPDHTSSAGTLGRLTGARVIAHASDAKTDSRQQARLSPLGGVGLPLPVFRGVPLWQTVRHGQVVPVQGGLRVVHSPGHTPGSVCYFLEKRGVLFTGDTLFSNGARLSRSVPFPGYNRRDLVQSCKELAGMEFETLCGGHGRPLMKGASEALGDLLASEPEPPTWGKLIKSVPRRLYDSSGPAGQGR